MKKAIIIGATSGIGQEVAGILVQQGWRIGIAGRREEVLRSMQQANPQQIEIQHLDVTKENAVLHLTELIDRLGGMDLFFLSSGIGYQNRNLEPRDWESHLPTPPPNGFRIHTSMLWHNSHGCSILISASPTSVRDS